VPKGPSKTTPGIDLPQQVFDPDARQGPIDGPTEVCEAWGHLRGGELKA